VRWLPSYPATVRMQRLFRVLLCRVIALLCRFVLLALLLLPPFWAFWGCRHVSTSTVCASCSLVLTRHRPLSAVFSLIAIFGPWVVLGTHVTSGYFVAFARVVTSTAMHTNPSFSFRPKLFGFVASPSEGESFGYDGVGRHFAFHCHYQQ
jgi:hypothetical protein